MMIATAVSLALVLAFIAIVIVLSGGGYEE